MYKVCSPNPHNCKNTFSELKGETSMYVCRIIFKSPHSHRTRDF